MGGPLPDLARLLRDRDAAVRRYGQLEVASPVAFASVVGKSI